MDPAVGDTLSHYHLLERVDGGGQGTIFKAKDLRLGRDVALKVLPEHALSDQGARRRFQKEARALSLLNHPNIQVIHDFDTQDGIDFLVSEFISGLTLKESFPPTGASPNRSWQSLASRSRRVWPVRTRTASCIGISAPKT